MDVLEKRYARTTWRTELRAAGDPKGLRFTGHAAVFDELSVPMWGYRERIDPAAFDETLAAKPDVRALWNHSADMPLARTSTGSLKLSTDDTGLKFDFTASDTSYARDLAQLIEDEVVTQCSFGFWILEDKIENIVVDGDSILVRTLMKLDLQDGDVSPVTYPAYPQTDANVRERRDAVAAFAQRMGVEIPGAAAEPDELRELVAELVPAPELMELLGAVDLEDRASVDEAIRKLSDLGPKEEPAVEDDGLTTERASSRIRVHEAELAAS